MYHRDRVWQSIAATWQPESTESSLQSKQCPSLGTWLLGWYLPPATQAEQKMRNLSVKTEQSKTTALSLQPSDNMWVEGPGSLDYSEDGLAPGSQLWPSLKGFQFCVRHREAS